MTLPFICLVGRKLVPGDVLGRSHYPLLSLTVRCRAVAIPGGDETGQDGLDDAAVEPFENLGTHAKSFQSPEGKRRGHALFTTVFGP